MNAAAANAATQQPPIPANQAWFLGAPWTKLICMIFVLVQVLHQHNQNQNQHSKLLLLQFQSTGDFVMGIFYLALQLRRIERELGCRQMGEFLLLQVLAIPLTSIVMNWIVNVFYVIVIVIGIVGSDSSSTTTTSTTTIQLPHMLIVATTYWYVFYTPRLYPNFISILGISFSEKSFLEVWGFYLIGHSINTTTTIVVGGIVSSAIYFGSLYQRTLVPNFIVNYFPWETMASLFLLDPPSPKVYAPAVTTVGVAGVGTAPLVRPPPARAPLQAPQPPPPSQDAIHQLTAMGFDEDRVRNALQQSNNNVERAADRLLMMG